MSGPAVGLWLFEPCGFEDILTGVAPWLETFCEPIEADGDLAFWVRDASPLGLQNFDPVGAGGFFLSEDECIPAEDEDYWAFSMPPVQGLVLGAGCSGRENHLLLGHLALAVARRLGALVDFDGVLGYPTPRDQTRDEADLAEARALVASLPGMVAEVSYDTGGGGRWFRYVGDVEFLAAWLRHPDFHLVK
ncbi:hypothetical protein CLM62_30255 [Streptomyces sp. SA15]|uniref:DUF6368 family protein n=1 Tax=Streptomyces sp. SA15 TaxID=934019 RepID=UPI000BB006CB|nr:DUF6368 family protein [Streptomyces sp. SA15]PAZ12462.1 hypothetical protein CLM62_30255 [Streptomyces sp. SA15]